MAFQGMTDRELMAIANNIGLEIDELGVHLGFTWRKVQYFQLRNILGFYLGSNFSGTMGMLHSWKKMRREPVNEHRHIFANCLVRAGWVNLSERVLEGKFIPEAENMNDVIHLGSTVINKLLILAGVLIVLLAIVCSVFCTNLLLLPTEIKELRKHLINYYNTRSCDIKTVPWNDSSILDLDDLFINLNLLQRGVDKNSNLVREDISYTKLFQIQKKGKVSKRILLRGAGGTGKTTLSCKIAHDWGSCLWGFSIRCTPLLIVLQLRLVDPTNSLGQEVVNQGLVPTDRHGSITADLINSYISQNPESAIIIFDGYDEYVYGSLKEDGKKGVLDILRYKSFRDTMVMVTCRPWRIADFENFPDYTHVELTGFTSENVVAYVNKFFLHNKMKSDDLLKWLSGGKYPDLTDQILKDSEVLPCDNYYFDCSIEDISFMARYPLFLAMFCELSKNGSFLTETYTVPDVFNNIIEYMYEQYINKIKDSERGDLVDFDNLKVFLGKPAYDSFWGQPGPIQNEKTVFTAEEFKNDTVFRLGSEIGFLTNIPENDYYRGRMPRRKVYTTVFFHKFVQEYFASCYFNHLHDNFPSRANRIQHIFAKDNTFIFFCASSAKVTTEEMKQYIESDSHLFVKEYVHTAGSKIPASFQGLVGSMSEGSKIENSYTNVQGQNLVPLVGRMEGNSKLINSFNFGNGNYK
ncbi:uncharacterized protein LOC135156157 [Lytechinus pictus]|uniref:uncharacterized protein LOC135156157 n=1 Tax=Lytechinus pictus TaxID=7653 RepID=UPI0030BA0741